MIEAYLEYIVPSHQYVPGCQVSVHKTFTGQILHPKRHLLTEA